MARHWDFPVSEPLLKWCQERIEVYKTRGDLTVILADKNCDNENLFYLPLVQELRGNYHLPQTGLGARLATSPLRFRYVANLLIEMHLTREFENKKSHTKIELPPWRAALAFFREFVSLSEFRRWNAHVYHLGAARDEKTLETKIYFDEPPPILRDNKFRRGESVHFYITDPMLASGNTIIDSVNRLMKYHIGKKPVTAEMITVMSLFAAPEGVVRIMEDFPGIKISTLVLDHHLDRKGFIVPGLGDFGDKYFDGLGIESFEQYVGKWMSGAAFAALSKRMKEIEKDNQPQPKTKALKLKK